jgi:DNA-directed RNA polymerase
MTLDCAEFPKVPETFYIYHLSYYTHVSSVNDAVVAANTLKKARSLLEDYIRKNPPNDKTVEMFLPEDRAFNWQISKDNKAIMEGVIYDSQVNNLRKRD